MVWTHLIHQQGTNEDQTFIGGILHGNAKQYVYNSISYNFYQDTLGTAPSPNEWEGTIIPCGTSNKLPLKCTPVLGGPGNDENCLSAKCMKCSYCFRCKPFPIQPGVFVGNNSSVPSTSGSTSGPGNGLTPGSGLNTIDGSETTPAFFPNSGTYEWFHRNF